MIEGPSDKEIVIEIEIEMKIKIDRWKETDKYI